MFYRDGSVDVRERERERGKEGKNNKVESRDNTKQESTGVNSMVTENRSFTVVWKNVRKMRSIEKPSEK